MSFGMNLFTSDGQVDTDALRVGRLIDAHRFNQAAGSSGSQTMSSDCLDTDFIFIAVRDKKGVPDYDFNNTTKVFSFTGFGSGGSFATSGDFWVLFLRFT